MRGGYVLKRIAISKNEMSLNEYLSSLKKPLSHLEHNEQVDLIKWTMQEDVLAIYPELEILYAIPNGGKRHMATAIKMKAEGAKRGVLDLHLSVARGIYHSLYIEMKAPKGTVSIEQKWWIRRLLLQANCVTVCYSADEAKDVLRHYLDGNHGLIKFSKVVDKIKKELRSE